MDKLNGLYEKRMFRGMTATAAADLINVTCATYRRYEEGTSALDVRHAAVLARHFECTIEELL